MFVEYGNSFQPLHCCCTQINSEIFKEKEPEKDINNKIHLAKRKRHVTN